MAYITNEDIEQRLGPAACVQMADGDGDGTADAAVIDEARRGAEGEVDSFLARRYQVPVDLAAHPELAGLLASVTLDMAEYRLRGRRPPVSEAAIRRRDEAIAWLERVAEGAVDLPSVLPVASSTVRGLRTAVRGPGRLLTRDELSSH